MAVQWQPPGRAVKSQPSQRPLVEPLVWVELVQLSPSSVRAAGYHHISGIGLNKVVNANHHGSDCTGWFFFELGTICKTSKSVLMQLAIRPYRPSDRDPVVTLFRIGIKEHIQPCFYNAISSSLHLSVSLLLCVSGYVLSSPWAALLLPTAWMGVVYYCCYRVYDGYVKLRLQTDMKDIVGSFLSRPDGCFWVAETEVDKRTQVVGMVAVIAKSDGRQKCGELFRMIIAPHCRRMGLGSKLAQTVFDFGKKQGFSKIILETSSTQNAGIALYRKLGFRLVRELDQGELPFWHMWMARVRVLKMEKEVLE